MRSTTLCARTFLLILAALAFSAAAPAQEYQSWKYLNPKPQPNLLRKMRMIDANTWVAVGANGTFMRTTNAGVDWYFHHQTGKFSNAAQAIGQNYDVWFFNAASGIVAGDRGFIGRTTNGGVTFDSVANGLIPVGQRAQSIWFADANTGYVGAGSGSGFGGTIVRTTDGGATWSSVYTTTATAVQAVRATDAQTVFAVMADGMVAKSTNGGTNWTESPGAVGPFMYAIEFLDANTGFVAGGGGLISKTTNAGASWTALTPPQTNWSWFQIEIVSAAEMYLVGDPSFLWKSTDLGATWASSPIAVSGPASTYIWYSIDKQGSTLAMSGDYGVVAKSTDGGTSWNSNHVNFGSQIMFDIQQAPGTQTLIAAGRQSTPSSGQILRSTNGGATWTRIDLGTATDLNAVSMVDAQTGYVCGTNSVVYKTTNGGQSWTQTTSPSATNYTLQAMEFVDASTGWIVVNFGTVPGGNIFKTTDGGTTWGQQTIGTADQIASLDMVDAATGYLTLNSSSRPIYKTTNGGTTWTPVTVPFTGQIRDVRALDANNVYIGAGSGTGTNRIGKSTDGGATWTQIALPIAVDVNSVDFKDVNNGYVTGNSTTVVCRTTDGGANWSFQNVHLPTLVKVYVTPADTAFVLGTYSAILRWGQGPQPLTGVKTVGGASPDFPTLKAAFRALNRLGTAAPGVTFLIRSGTYTEDSLTISTATAGPAAPVIVRPAAGATVVVNVAPPSTSYDWAISIDSTSFVTIDGAAQGGPPNARNMTIVSQGATGRKGVRVFGNSDDCTIRNVIVSCEAPVNSSANRGIDVFYHSIAGTNPDRSVMQNIYVKRAGVGIRLEGATNTNRSLRGLVENCLIGTGAGDSIGFNGIYTWYTDSVIVRNNVIRNLWYYTGGPAGIQVSSYSPYAQVYGNDISGIQGGTASSLVIGISINGTQNPAGPMRIYNNFVSNLVVPDAGTGAIYGIYLAHSNTPATVVDTVLYNSVNLTGTNTGLRQSTAFACNVTTTGQGVYARNNIFKNTRVEGAGATSYATAIRKSSAASVLVADNNALYTGGTDTTRPLGVLVSQRAVTLADWRTASGGDAASVTDNVPFVSTTDLHINPAVPSPVNGGAAPVSVTTDIDGQPRNALTPDIGADEFTPAAAVAEQFKDHRTATMLTSVTNEGNFGSLNAFVGTGPGSGFQFNPVSSAGQRLFEGALIIATDSLHVSDAARNNANPEVFDADFKFAALIDSTQAGPILLRSTAYNDSLAEAPLYVRVNQTTVSVDTVGQSGILHVQLDVTNTGAAPLANMTVGGFFDWDVNPSNAQDRGSVLVDSTNQIPGVNGGNPFRIEILEMHQAVAPNSWVGIVPLSANRFKGRRVAVSSTEIYPPRMTNADKWTYINFYRATNPNGDGNANVDHAQIFGLPSFTLAPAATRRVGFAMVAGTSLADLVNAARAAQRNWVQRLGNPIEIVPAGVKDDLAGIPESYDLSQNYPNPFNPSTVIRYALPEASQVTMRVYNLLGQEVVMLVNDVREAGYHEVVWNSRNNAGVTLATGVYFYRIEAKTLDGANAFTSLKKMLLVK